MGISLREVHLLGSSLSRYDLDSRLRMRILTLGVQDCHFSYAELIALLRRHSVAHNALERSEIEFTTGFQWVPESERSRYRENIHQVTLFRVLGFRRENVFSLDRSDFETPSILHDLNFPVDSSLHSHFDLVFDGGTLEHVFSTRDAFFNMVRMCRQGGIVIHCSPVDFINHGYYNFNAEVFDDFYRINGFARRSVLYFAYRRSNGARIAKDYLVFSPETVQFSLHPLYNLGFWGEYEKLHEGDPQIPQQGFYDRLWQEARDDPPAMAGQKREPAETSRITPTPRALIKSIVEAVPGVGRAVRAALRAADGLPPAASLRRRSQMKRAIKVRL